MRCPLLRTALALALALSLGCAGEAAQSRTGASTGAKGAPAKPEPPPPVVPPGHLARRDVDLALTRLGLPWLFRRVMRKGVVDKAGKFAGWELIGLPEEWSSVDLRPGDIVNRVNGLPLETPENAWEAWKSVAKVKEIRLNLTRDGAARELVIPIDGPPTPEVIQTLDRTTPPPRQEGPPRRRVITIGGGDDEPDGD